PVSAPQHIEGVATNRHGAECAVDDDIAEHAQEDVARDAELVGLVHDEQGQRRRDDVADGRYESNQWIEAETDACAGMTSALSRRVASASTRAIRARRERGRTKSEPKPYAMVIVVCPPRPQMALQDIERNHSEAESYDTVAFVNLIRPRCCGSGTSMTGIASAAGLSRISRAPAHRRYCRYALLRFKACTTAAQRPGDFPPSFRQSRRKGAGVYRSARLIGREVRAVLDRQQLREPDPGAIDPAFDGADRAAADPCGLLIGKSGGPNQDQGLALIGGELVE